MAATHGRWIICFEAQPQSRFHSDGVDENGILGRIRAGKGIVDYEALMGEQVSPLFKKSALEESHLKE